MRRRALTAADVALLTILGLLAPLHTIDVLAQDIPPPAAEGTAVPSSAPLQLEVFINDASTNLIGTFRRETDGRITVAPDELRTLGLLPDKQALGANGAIDLAKLPGVSFQYDEAIQSIRFTVQQSAQTTREIDVMKDPSDDGEAQTAPSRAVTGVGGLINYTIYGASGGEDFGDIGTFNGLSGAFEARLYSRFGVLSSSQVLSSSPDTTFDAVRLDSDWSYTDEQRLVNYRLGDIITGGLSWTRPTRLGGFQLQRNFGARPDLVTMPLPELSGSAAVPSTVDVYIDNARRVSREVPAGPFAITNLPVVTGNGTARLVVRDALGRETVSETPFYASSDLLAPGLWDFSLDAGFARRFYGTESNDYDGRPMASGMIRYGVADWLTLEGHAEGGIDLINGGLGGVFAVGSYGLGTLAGAMSVHDGETGFQLSATAETDLWGVHFFARSQRTFGAFDDIASVTAPRSRSADGIPRFSARPPRSLDQVSLSVPLGFDPTSLNVSFTKLETAERETSRIFGVTASRPIGERGNAFATAYADLDRKSSYGIFVGLSWTFGNDISASTGLTSDAGGYSIATDLVKSENAEGSGTGWRLRDVEGQGVNRSASVSHRSAHGHIDAGVQQYGRTARANAQVDGAVVFAGGDVFLSNRVDDAFVVVDAGAPGVDVLFENRPIGQTNRRGKILLPNLRAYEKNRISIDPTNLPLDSLIDSTGETVVPRSHSGTVLNFAVKADTQAAQVTLRDDQGQPVEAGATGQVEGGTENFVVGYDGQAYISGLSARNRVLISQPTRGRCEAEFTFQSVARERAFVPDAICRAMP
jgi:outer membrane usher protein